MSFLTKFYGGDDGAIARVDSNLGFATPYAIESQVKPLITRQLAQLPKQANQSAVVQETRRAAELEATAANLKKIAEVRKRQLNATESIYKTQAEHQGEVMKTAKTIAEIDRKHGQAVLAHGLGMAQERAELSGWQQAYQNASSLVNSI